MGNHTSRTNRRSVYSSKSSSPDPVTSNPLSPPSSFSSASTSRSKEDMVERKCSDLQRSSTSVEGNSSTTSSAKGKRNKFSWLSSVLTPSRFQSSRGGNSTPSAALSTPSTSHLSSHSSGPEDLNETYKLPDLELEAERMANYQDIIIYSQRKLFRSPVPQPKRALEIRVASTKWLSEMAKAFPKATIYGLNGTKAPLPLADRLPPNAKLLDAFLPVTQLPFPPKHFDLIYGLSAIRYIPKDKLIQALTDIHDLILPGGWIEMWEHNNELLNGGPFSTEMVHTLQVYLNSKGSGLGVAPAMDNLLAKVGFLHTDLRSAPLPLGEWGGARGRLLAQAVLDTLRNIADSMIMVDGNTHDGTHFHNLISDWEEELHHTQCSLVVYSAIGQRTPK